MVDGHGAAPILITCEHASERLPDGWQWPDADRRLLGTHWAYDLGARELTLELAAALDAPAVLSRFSRLLADANRDEDHRDLFRSHAEGEPVYLNANVDEVEAERRLERTHRPYHRAIDTVLHAHDAPIIFSIHTFTPDYEGNLRDVQLGVLYNRDEAAAFELGVTLQHEFEEVRHNEPWSGKAGLIWSPEHHAETHGRVCLEIEVRQDLAMDAGYRQDLTRVLAGHFAESSA